MKSLRRRTTAERIKGKDKSRENTEYKITSQTERNQPPTADGADAADDIYIYTQCVLHIGGENFLSARKQTIKVRTQARAPPRGNRWNEIREFIIQGLSSQLSGFCNEKEYMFKSDMADHKDLFCHTSTNTM